MLEEILESPAFWMLGVGGVAAEILGLIASRRMGLDAFPMWQFVILVIGTLGAAAFFALRD